MGRATKSAVADGQRMEALGRLAGGIAHDFNNLLTIILGYNELALGSLSSEDPLREDLQEVRRAARTAARLSSKLLGVSRQRPAETQALNPNDLVLQVSKLLRRVVSEDIEFVTRLPPHGWNVEADPVQMDQVLINLVVNACDAMPQGGRLTVGTRYVSWRRATEGERTIMPSGDYAVLFVSDNGVGMSAEVRARIFEPFFTTKEIGRGTGLGLSTVYDIVKRIGGYVWVESRPAQGATFEVYLPRTRRPAVASDTDARLVHAPRAQTILLAEDDDAVRGYASRVLGQAGYRVLTARDGAEALELWDNHAGEIHLLIVDVVMPSLSGPELARCVSRLLPPPKLLFVSGYADEALERHQSSNSDVPLLRKPFSPAELIQRVQEILDQSIMSP